MENIVPISGKVNFTITLDPGVWIFDDRRLDLDTYFTRNEEITDELEEYKKNMSKHWDREIMEGAIYPPTLKTEKKYEKEKVLNGSFAMPLRPFLKNAEPHADANTITLITSNGEVDMSLRVGEELILAFSNNGKPLAESGPIHAYYGDGSNQTNPIIAIKQIVVR